MNVLVIDDDDDIREALRTLLGELGYGVREACNGQEGLACARGDRPDAIICDGMMPVMDGFQLLRTLKQDRELAAIPFIFFSAVYTGGGEQDFARELGADAFLVKPGEPGAVQQALRAAMAGRSFTGPSAPVPTGKYAGFAEEYPRIVATALEGKVRQLDAVRIELEHAELELRESEAAYRRLFESNPHAMWVYDTETLVFLAVNNAAVRQYGYDRREFLSMTIKDIRPPDELSELLEAVSGTEPLRSGTVWRHRKKDGAVFDAEITSHAIEFGGKRARIVLVCDISEQIRMDEMLRTASEEWRHTFDAMTEAVSLLDGEGRIVRCNRALAELLDKPFAELIGMVCTEICVCFGGQRQECPFLRSGLSLKRETGLFHKGERWFEASADPIVDASGEFRGAVHVLRDITERRLLEEQIFQKKQDWEYTFDSITDMVTVHDKDWNIILANKAAEKILGLQYLEMERDTKCFRYYHGTDGPPDGCPSCGCLQSGAPASFEVFEPHLNLYIEIRAIPRVDRAGNLIGLIHVVRDITERKKNDEAIARYNRQIIALSEASNRLMASTSLEEIHQLICDITHSVFEATLVWLGVPETEGFRIRPVAHAGQENGYLSSTTVTWDDSPTGWGPIGAAVRTGKTVSARTSDPLFAPWSGEARKRGYEMCLAVPLKSPAGKCIGTLNLYGKESSFNAENIRIAEIFANQATIAIENARLVEGLETKVLERTREIENANSELQAVNRELVQRREEADAASRAKTDFLANMSHELRTPLNAILGFSEIMLMEMAGKITEKQREFLTDISKSGGHLLSLINDILDLSKVEAGMTDLEPEPVLIADLIAGAMMLFKEKTLKHGIRVETVLDPSLPEIAADRRKLKQVLVNLLSNAFKFTPDGGTVRVESRLVGESVEFSVSDTGAGIEPEHLSRLFQPFQQIDNSLTRKHAGTGLGLSLCRRFVELHGGGIGVESEPGKGSTFRFTIPVRRG